MSKLLKAVFKRLFQVFVFLLPVQLGYHFWPTWAFVFGIRVDYLSPTLYLTDALFLVLLLLFVVTQKAGKKVLFFGLMIIVVFGFINSTSAASLEPSVYKWTKMFELFSLGLIVAKSKDLKVKDWIVRPLLLSLVGVSLIAALQVTKGGSLGGLFYFLGERSFTLSTPGIALASLGGREILRAYSVFSHPNSLAGFLVAGTILVSPFLLKRLKRFSSLLFLVAAALAFILTFSLATALSLLLVAGTVVFFKKSPQAFTKFAKALLFFFVVLSVALPILASRYPGVVGPLGESYSRRADLSVAAGKMFAEKPFFGIGLNNFTIRLPEKGVGPSSSWWLQPVHNVFLLSLSETGLVGFLLLVLIFYLGLNRAGVNKKQYLVAGLLFVVLTGFFDHYWVTLQQNQLLLAIIFGLSFKNG